MISCIFSLVACNIESEELTSNSISDCPIANRKFIISFQDTDDEELINQLPTVYHFFKAIEDNHAISKDVEINWDSPKDNYYIFSLDITDVATNEKDNTKFGIVIVKSGRAILNDVWINDKQLPTNSIPARNNIFDIVITPYRFAQQLAQNESSENNANGIFEIKLGNYFAKYNGGEAVISLKDGGEGFFEAETYNRIKWKQVNSEIEMRIYGEEGSPQFTVINAKILSDTSFDLEGLVYNLVKE